MSVTGKLYGKTVLAWLNKEVDWDSDVIKVTLHSSSYVPDQDADDYANDATNQLSSGSGYTSGGATLGSKTITYTGASNTITLDGADVVWTTSTLTARVAVVSDTTPGSAATNPLICYQLSSSDVSSSGGDFTVSWNASGIASIVVS